MVPEVERGCPRYEVATDCLVLTRQGERLLGDRTVDLSWDGLQVAGAPQATLGEDVDIELRVPDSALWVRAQGRVARRVLGKRRGEAPGLGIRITRMDGMSRVLLASVMRAFPLAVPRRGPARDYARMVARIMAE